MRHPSSRVRPTRVTLLKHAWGKDADAGRVITATITTDNVACSIQPGDPMTSVDETGRWTNEVGHVLRFNTDPGLKAHDEITWKDSERVHNLVVLGTVNRMGRGATYEVNTIERI